ncbi:MAG TPA: ribosome maturation factor RimM [Candidatus Baltobacteraceae bacterium]|nr:ribosome maturation factor RimM [Candidatus Baltobacteraceae bacterium]
MRSSSNELPVGRIAGVFGIRGELKCDPTSAGRMLFSRRAHLRLAFAGGASQDVEIAAVREHKGRLLIRLHGVESANDAERYVGATFYADRERIELESGEYLDVDLAGCMLYDPQDKMLGTVSAVEHYPSSDMLVVNGKLVPMIAEFIKSIDVTAKRIDVDLPPGLLDDSAEEA